MRSYVEARLGPQMLPKLYHLTDQPGTIPFDNLPDKFVVKPTHGSGWVEIVTDKAALDSDAFIRTCRGWLSRNFYELTREWAYKNIEPRILVEEFVDDGSGISPRDYKFFVFDGNVEFIKVDALRFTDHRNRIYTADWRKLDVLFWFEDIDGELPRPLHLAEMVAASEAIDKDFDFICVDFYDTPERIYLGELTPTAGCGREPIRPREFDYHLGSRWTLPARESRWERVRRHQATRP
jgi:hypothetical protein